MNVISCKAIKARPGTSTKHVLIFFLIRLICGKAAKQHILGFIFVKKIDQIIEIEFDALKYFLERIFLALCTFR